jgi:hypothetical protein
VYVTKATIVLATLALLLQMYAQGSTVVSKGAVPSVLWGQSAYATKDLHCKAISAKHPQWMTLVKV